MKLSDLKGAMTDPCPVCNLKPAKGINMQGEDPEPTEGAVTICFGCSLIQIIHGGMRCALTEEEADHLFSHLELVQQLVVIAKMRATNPFRTMEMVREQLERETGG